MSSSPEGGITAGGIFVIQSMWVGVQIYFCIVSATPYKIWEGI
jgi:hypothetical protein